MQTFNVCIVNLQPSKTAIITQGEQVVGVINGECMSNAEFFRSFAKFILERTRGAPTRIVTNQELVQRKNHTANFPSIIFNYKRFSYPRRQHFLDAAYAWTDKQDKANQKQTKGEMTNDKNN